MPSTINQPSSQEPLFHSATATATAAIHNGRQEPRLPSWLLPARIPDSGLRRPAPAVRVNRPPPRLPLAPTTRADNRVPGTPLPLTGYRLRDDSDRTRSRSISPDNEPGLGPAIFRRRIPEFTIYDEEAAAATRILEAQWDDDCDTVLRENVRRLRELARQRRRERVAALRRQRDRVLEEQGPLHSFEAQLGVSLNDLLTIAGSFVTARRHPE